MQTDSASTNDGARIGGLRRVAEGFLRAVRVLEKVAGVFLIVDLSLIIFLMIMQVVNRYVLKNPFSWTEELARYLYVWGTIIGAGMALRRFEMVGVTFVVDLFKPRLRKLFRVVAVLVVTVLFYYFARYGYALLYTALIGRTLSPALQMPMAVIYSVFPVGGALIVVFSLACLVEVLLDRR